MINFVLRYQNIIPENINKQFLLIIILFSIAIAGHCQESINTLKDYYREMYKNQDQIATYIQKEITQLINDRFLEFEGEKNLSTGFLPSFYEERDYRPAWSNFRPEISYSPHPYQKEIKQWMPV